MTWTTDSVLKDFLDDVQHLARLREDKTAVAVLPEVVQQRDEDAHLAGLLHQQVVRQLQQPRHRALLRRRQLQLLFVQPAPGNRPKSPSHVNIF